MYAWTSREINRAINGSDDVDDVTCTANTLQTSEFEVFRAAYQAWYQHEADVRLLERYFAVYLFEGTAPFWVRSFTRRNLAEEARALGSAAVRAEWASGAAHTALILLPMFAFSGVATPGEMVLLA